VAQMISGPRLLGLSPPVFETGCIGFQMSFFYSGCWGDERPLRSRRKCLSPACSVGCASLPRYWYPYI